MSHTTIMGARKISAIVFDHDNDRSSTLITITRDHFNGDEREAEEISIHGPAEVIHQYANALNACNDREAVEHGSNNFEEVSGSAAWSNAR